MDLLYSTENSTHYSVWEKYSKRNGYIYVYVYIVFIYVCITDSFCYAAEVNVTL